MSEEIKPTESVSTLTVDEKDSVIAKLSEQVENLNKGIASYRKEASDAVEVAKDLSDRINSLEEKYKEKVKLDLDEELSPEEQKKFETWAKAQGVVTQAELDVEKQKSAQENAKTVATTAVDEFLDKHPEYDDDEAWGKIQEEFALYKTPKDIVGYKKLLEKIHKDLSGGSDSKARVKAEIINRKRLSLGGKPSNGSGDGDVQAKIDSLQEKYPNLSREQIEARLSEIDTIYKK